MFELGSCTFPESGEALSLSGRESQNFESLKGHQADSNIISRFSQQADLPWGILVLLTIDPDWYLVLGRYVVRPTVKCDALCNIAAMALLLCSTHIPLRQI
jgi:hypothetical protein